MSHQFWAIVPAAGAGKRMGGEVPKQYLEVLGKPVLEHTLERLLSVRRIERVIVALSEQDGYWESIPLSRDPRIVRTNGGSERFASVYQGLIRLNPLAAFDDWVLVHDAARLCITVDDIENLMNLQSDPVGGILALPVSDTLKTVEEGLIQNTVDRTTIWRAQTPQMFRFGILKRAMESAMEENRALTDEASAIEYLGYQPRIVQGRSDNIKVTHPEDLSLAAYYLEKQC